jgi:hypothetical protein
MAPVPPFWFHQRQGKMEPAGTDTYRLTGPNLAEAFIGIQAADSGQWRPVFRQASDGPDLAEGAPARSTPREAWEAAFELYRIHVVV